MSGEDRGGKGSVLLQFDTTGVSAPPPEAIRRKWTVWQNIMRGRKPSERAALLREATQGFSDPGFKGATLVEQPSGDAGPGSRAARLAALQDRLAVAEAKRVARLQAVRQRAAARSLSARGLSAAGNGAQQAPQRASSLGVAVSEAGPSRLVLDRMLAADAEGPARRRAGSPRKGLPGSPRKAVAVIALRKGLPGSPRKGAALLPGSPRKAAAGSSPLRRPTHHAPRRSSGTGEARRARWLAQLEAAAEAQHHQQQPAAAQPPSPRSAAAERLRRQASSRQVQRLWREFVAQRKTTSALAAALVECGVTSLAIGPDGKLLPSPAAPASMAAPQEQQQTEGPGPVFVGGVLASGQLPRHEEFEAFAAKLQSARTLRAAAALFKRLEARLAARGASMEGAQVLLKRLFPAAAAGGRHVDRYPVRVALVAFMIREHPDVVFNTVGEVEAQLSAAAGSMLAALEALISKVLEPTISAADRSPATPDAATPTGAAAAPKDSPLKLGIAAYRASSSGGASDGARAKHVTLGELLVKFDDEWLEYLDQFVLWKGRDAASLEAELIGIAVKLERSMRRKLAGRDPAAEAHRHNVDLQAMVSQVSHDHSLLHERVRRLTGEAGVARLDAALAAVREEVAAEVEEAMSDEGAWESVSEAGRSTRLGTRPPSRAASLRADAADPQPEAPQPQEPQQQSEGTTNEQMVWEMLYNPRFSLPVAEAEAAWDRAAGREESPEEIEDPESMPPAQLAAIVARRARSIAERAFWDSITWRFATAIQGGGLPGQLAPLLSELGLELASLLGGAAAGERGREEARVLEEAYQEPRVLSRLASRAGRQGGGADLTETLAAIEQLGRGALAAAAPARAEDAAHIFAEAQAALLAAAAAGDADATGAAAADSAPRAQALAQALAPALARALRLTMAQVKLAKVDAANARLAALAAAMQERGAVAYLRGKLAAAYTLPEPGTADFTRAALSERLPRTAAWLSSLGIGRVEGELPVLRRALAAAGLELDASQAAGAVVAGGLPSASLRTGLRAFGASVTAAAAAAEAARAAPRDAFGLVSGAADDAAGDSADGAVRPTLPALASGDWKGTLRAALVALVARDTPAVSPALAEVLVHDRERLHQLQNGLQQLVVAAAGLLIVQQLRAAAGTPWAPEARAAARRRLMVLLSDQGMRLSDLVTEITRLANEAPAAPGAAADAAAVDEERVRGMFTSLVDPSAAAFQSVKTALASVLLAHALYGRAALAPEAGGDAGRAAAAALARVGAGPLAGDVAALGERLGLVAGAVEAVWGDALSVLLA